MDTVARVINVASQGCCITSLDDSSAFRHILLCPSSWPRFGFSYGGIDYCYCGQVHEHDGDYSTGIAVDAR